MGANRIARLTFSFAMLPTGGMLVLLGGEGRTGQLVNSLGLSLIVAGIVNGFRELAIARYEAADTAEAIATRLHEKLVQSPPVLGGGLRMASPVRRGYAGYYGWAIAREPRELFFAGRSVLHRIDADFRTKGLRSAEEVLLRTLQDGSVVRILFLDPRSDLISRLAEEERQSREAMLSDIATSLGICRRLSKLIEANSASVPTSAQLDIRVYDEVPYFAYHRDDEHVIVGFYFVTALGSASAAFEVSEPQTRGFFEGHFTSIFGRAIDRIILVKSATRHSADFNTVLFEELCEKIAAELGQQRTNQLLGDI